MVTILWVLAFVCVLWVSLAKLPAGMEGHMPMPYLIALIPFAWIPLLGIGIWSGVLRQWGPMCLCLAWLAIALDSALQYRLSLLPRWMSRPTSALGDPLAPSTTQRDPLAPSAMQRDPLAPAASSEEAGSAAAEATDAPDAPRPVSCRVMTLNCRYGRADAAAIVQAVRNRRIDVLALQECTDDLIHALQDAGINAVLPYMQQGEPKQTDNGGYNVVFSHAEPVGRQVKAVEIPAADVPAVTLRIGGREVTFASAHPKSPMRGCPQWSEGIVGLGALANAVGLGDHGIAVVMGDLNSMIEHPSFRRLLASGFRDASLTEAHGRHATYPAWLPWPRIELDHVLVTPGAEPHGVESFRVDGTDHLALTATLTI
ncbi:endonuclease [Bifidobacterium sp. DSM 109958]|uniref:Endonuclease n=1 Tax=Bifidobacterium moraviense TaxID=2675323 RepID=A0A7Y0HZU8_9BIFI|nr:endonuclease/exonuclease/phosphatase family protein [Bifidobacterium sp. DSM 109958]NMN00773.1 endonuclease [Bifidobacterium sp. DSM 109958]